MIMRSYLYRRQQSPLCKYSLFSLPGIAFADNDGHDVAAQCTQCAAREIHQAMVVHYTERGHHLRSRSISRRLKRSSFSQLKSDFQHLATIPSTSRHFDAIDRRHGFITPACVSDSLQPQRFIFFAFSSLIALAYRMHVKQHRHCRLTC